MSLAFLMTALALIAGPQQGDPDPRPASGDLPELPRSELRRGAEPEGGGTELAPNGGVAGCLFATGQKVVHPFQARAGELVLLELSCAGYARGWSAIAHLAVEGPDGELLLDRTRRGGVEFTAFAGLVAPRDGQYRLRLTAREGGFRYRLVRHSDFAPRTAESAPRPVGGRAELFDHLLHDGDAARFTLELAAGECVALSVASPDAAAVESERMRRREEGPVAVLAGLRGEASPGGAMGADDSMGGRRAAAPPMGRGDSMQGAPSMGVVAPGRRMQDQGAAAGRSWPLLRLTVLGPDGERVGAPGHYLRFDAPVEGTYQVLVDSAAEGQGGLLRLAVEREPERSLVQGIVADGEGGAASGVRLTFLREPDLDPEGEARTDREGRYRVELRPGPYTVLARRGGDEPEVLRTHVELEEELHLLVGGAPR